MEPTLKLGIFLIEPTETRLIITYLKLLSNDNEPVWEASETPPFDAVLYSSANPPPVNEFPHLGAIKIGEANDENADINRPLRLDKLEKALQKLIAKNTNTKKISEYSPESNTITSYRLKRWPPNSILHRDPMRLKIATMLLRKPLPLAEIIHATNANEESLKIFIDILKSLSLLEENQFQKIRSIENKSDSKMSSILKFLKIRFGISEHAGA